MAKLPLKEGPLRLLIATSFGMFAWASRDIVQWCKEFERTAPRDLPSRSVRPWISHGLMLGRPRGSEMIQGIFRGTTHIGSPVLTVLQITWSGYSWLGREWVEKCGTTSSFLWTNWTWPTSRLRPAVHGSFENGAPYNHD